MNRRQLDNMKIQEKLRSLVEQKQKADSQNNEILMAKEEIDLLEDDAVIYKMVGPLMVPQDLKEVKAEIDFRLNYMKGKIQMIELDFKMQSTMLE